MRHIGSLALLAWPEVRESPLFFTILTLATIGATVLFLLGVVAYRRRRSAPYLLITLALGALVVQAIVGLGTALGRVPMGLHHLVDHGLDVLIATLLLWAIYRSGRADRESDRDRL